MVSKERHIRQDKLTLRQADLADLADLADIADIAGIQRFRYSVRENRLTSRVISDAEVVDAIERTGRGWVVEVDSQVVAFAIGDGGTGNHWSFAKPAHKAGPTPDSIASSRGAFCQPI